ncbi:MAG: formyltetrahydrofolate deformylase [Lysobacterales bacterium]
MGVQGESQQVQEQSTDGAAFILNLICPDQMGIVRDVTTFIADKGGNIIDSAQFSDQKTGRFCMRLHFEIASDAVDRQSLDREFMDIGKRHAMEWGFHDFADPARMLVMVSRFDHCLRDLLYRIDMGELNVTIPVVVSNHRDAYQLVASHDIPFVHLPVDKSNKRQQEARLLDILDEERIDFVVLARYMQIISAEVCDSLKGRLINIHHSFLPGFKGARPYHQAHARGVKLIGATAHYATPELDEGPIIEQDVTRVNHAQTPAQLVAMGREIETRVLSRAVRYQAEHRVMLNDDKTVVFA